MSTLQFGATGQRMAKLIGSGEHLFHTKDLATLWEIENANTLRVTLKRYVDAGLLHRIYKGFYSTLPPKKLDPSLIGSKALHRFCYLSTETILYQEGYINQHIDTLTFVSDTSLKFTAGQKNYLSRQLKPEFLYNSIGIKEHDGYRTASAERAAADLLYFNPLYHFDRTPDFKKIRSIQKNIGYPLTPKRYANT
jgi:hypothetical protein